MGKIMNRALGTCGTIYTLVIIVLGGGKRGKEIIYEGLWLKNSQIIVKDINLQFQEAQGNPKGIKLKKAIPRRILIKLL